MRLYRDIIAIGVFAAALAVPANAQDAVSDPMMPPPPPMEPDAGSDATFDAPMSEDQKLAYDMWGVDQQAAYNAWPSEAKAYFWSLPETRQQLFFRLSENDRATLLTMPEAKREEAWAMVEGQVQQGMPGSEMPVPPPATPETSEPQAPEGE